MTQSDTARPAPTFTGIDTYRDPLGRFSIRFPSDWQTFEFSGNRVRRSGHEKRGTSWQRSKRAAAARARKAAKILAAAREASEENPLPAREGFGFSPNPADPHTTFTVWVAPLPEKVLAEDAADLRQGVDAGLAQLEGSVVEHAADDVLGNLVKFERVYTFREEDAVRKRRQWLLYVDTWLMTLTWQGSSPEEYQHYLAMANHSFFGFELPQALWFATDRTLAGQPREDAGGGPQPPNRTP